MDDPEMISEVHSAAVTDSRSTASLPTVSPPPRSSTAVAVAVAFGVLASASAPIVIKLTPLPPMRLAAGRLLLAAILLAPIALVAARRAPGFGLRRWVIPAILPGILLGLHFSAWNAGVMASPTADAALIGNLAPLVLPVLLVAVASERITRREIAATVISLAGLVLRWGAAAPSVGDLLCLLAMVLYAAYLALGRRNRSLPSVWPYVALVYAIGGVACALLSMACERWSPPTSTAWLGIIALAIVPTVVGHSVANWAMRHLRGQVVSLCFLLAPPLTGIYAWLLWHERPGPGWAVAFIGVAVGLVVLAVPLPAWLVTQAGDRRGKPSD